MTNKARREAVSGTIALSHWMVLLVLCALVFSTACGDDNATNKGDTQSGPDVVNPGDATVNPDVVGDQTTPPDTTPNTTDIGAACTMDGGECSGICATTLPGGYCTQACDTAACPAGTECRQINDFPFCMESCAADGDCRVGDGYTCLNGVCDIACKSLFDCGLGEQCLEGVCQVPPPDRIVGASCDTSSQCISGYCLTPADGGVCAEPCNGGGCSKPEWTCRALVPEGGGAGDALSLCGPGGLFTSEEVEIVGGNPRTFNVSSDVVSFMIIAEANSPYSWAYMENLRRPNGTLAAGTIGNDGFTAPYRMYPNTGHASAMFPNNADPALQVVPGEWSVDIYASTGIDRARVFFKRSVASGEVVSTTFDLNVFIASGARAGLTAATAPNDSHVSGALARVRNTYWTKHGILMGNVTYHDIPSSYANVSDEGELHEMWSTFSGSVPPGSLNIFLVRDILNGQAAGISGGIPGPVGVTGVGGGGVAIQIQEWAAGTGDNISHEVGHFLGFFHVTEIAYNNEPLTHDVIADTAQCNTSPGNMWNYNACMDNIMFPILLTGTGVDQSLSDTQGWVVRLNPRGK